MPDDENIVGEIVIQARARNRALHLTGALLFTHQHFAQYLEGPEAGVADLMASIRRDPRHTEIEIVASRRRDSRRFGDWDMGYAGPSELVSLPVEAVFGTGSHGATSLSAERLVRLMLDLARSAAPRTGAHGAWLRPAFARVTA
jgi:hypothetical protein